MFDCFCLDKTDKILLEESVANEIMSIEESKDIQKKGRKDNLGNLLREIIATKECPRKDYRLQKGIQRLGWKW